MKTLGVIIMAIFLSTIYCSKQNTIPECKDIFPADSFFVVNAIIDNKPVMGSFNFAYKHYKQKEKYPWCLTLSIALNLDSLFDNGLPFESEYAIAAKLEDELLTEIKNLATAHYIGHLFNDTFLDVFIYLDEPQKVHDYLQLQINKKGLVRGFGYEINQDPKWTRASLFLK